MEEHQEHHHQGHRHEIHFTVDGEPFETDKRELTPNEIIKEFGGQDPATNYLVQIKDGHKISYQGKGNEPIEMHNGMQFQIVSTGPTPVSEGPIRTGVAVFVEGLQQLGYQPTQLPGKPDHVVISYKVETGRRAGITVRHGFIVPPDFPATAPSGPHVSPRIHPTNPTQTPHPTGGIHLSSGAFEQGVSGEWQYWSRPFPNWATSKKTAATYMRHIWRLWDTQ